MQQGGSLFGTPPLDMSHFSTPPPPAHPQMVVVAAAAEPISSRPPQQQQPSPAAAGPNYDELESAEAEGPASGGVSGGNRWPRQETLALLKIRSDMDAAFRDATLKSPLWEEVSRKLGELGYKRSAKKCKEKFENVHKYYKRTKEAGRTGRLDGKSYRFFSQLEALQTNTPRGSSVFPPLPSPDSVTVTAVTAAAPIAPVPNPSPRLQPQISAPTPIATAPPPMTHPNVAGISFSSNTSSDAASEEEATEEEQGGKKRKRQGGAGGPGGRKLMEFFEGLMRQVVERQEAMQQRFLDAIEKRENEQTIRDEAWRKQEAARLARKHEIAAAERAAASARDAAVMSFLQKATGPTVPILPPPTILTSPATPAKAPPASSISIAPTPTLPQPIRQQQPLPRPNSSELILFEPQEGVGAKGVSPDPTSSRWPKSEVHALIKLRSGLDSRYQDSGPKGPLWEEISSGMKRIGYDRSAKRCKEKWENINKYFKKVKESNKNRPEDAKTCPYFHQLDALYRSKLIGGSSGGNTSVPALPERPHEHENIRHNSNPNPISVMQPPPPPPPPPPQQQQQPQQKDSGGGASINGGTPSTLFGGGNGDDSTNTNAMLKKPEDIVMDQSNTNEHGRVDELDSDDMDEDEDDDDEDDGETQYRIQFQGQSVSSGNGNGASVAPSGGKTAAGRVFLGNGQMNLYI